MKTASALFCYAALALIFFSACSNDADDSQGGDATEQENEENKEPKEKIPTHYIGLPGAILVKLDEIAFQSKIRIEIETPVRAEAFQAIQQWGPLITHRIHFAFSQETPEYVQSVEAREGLQVKARDIVQELFEEKGIELKVVNVLFVEYLVR